MKQKFPYLTDAGHRLMNQMLFYNPDKRISALDALEHPYFNGNIPSDRKIFFEISENFCSRARNLLKSLEELNGKNGFGKFEVFTIENSHIKFSSSWAYILTKLLYIYTVATCRAKK